MPEWNIIQAVNDALRVEMRRDPSVVVLGEDVGKFGGVFRATAGLYEEFGPERVIDTPLAEAGIVGAAIGMAMYGLRPVPEVQFSDFIYTPPNLPTSSPSTTTDGSRRISTRSASLTAWMMFHSGICWTRLAACGSRLQGYCDATFRPSSTQRWTKNSPALYELRTRGPAATNLKPRVRMSQPAERRSRIAWSTSPRCSPRPSMMDDLVLIPPRL